MAFFVELADASALVDGEAAKDKSLDLPDARANGDGLYRGVFWQVTKHRWVIHISTMIILHFDTKQTKQVSYDVVLLDLDSMQPFEASLADPLPFRPGLRPLQWRTFRKPIRCARRFARHR